LEKLSQSNLNRYYSPAIEFAGIGFTALGVSLSFAIIQLKCSGFFSFGFSGAVFFAVAGIYAFIQFLSQWEVVSANRPSAFFRPKGLTALVSALGSILLLRQMQALPGMQNGSYFWPLPISILPGQAGLWLPVFLLLCYMVFSRFAKGSMQVWLKASLLATAAASLLFAAIIPQLQSVWAFVGLFAPCWVNVLVCAYLDRQKDKLLNLPTLEGRHKNFPLKAFLILNTIVFWFCISLFFRPHFIGWGLSFYFGLMLFLVFFEKKIPLFAKRWLPDLMLFTAFL
jgi:hypothetical protein